VVEGVSASSDELSASSETQASELGSISEAINKMSLGIKNIAGLAQQALVNANHTTQTAAEGEEQAKAAAGGMRLINQKMDDLTKNSDQSGEIVATIEDIADQTNLLAFNAQIEAAKAGMHGRGFAVVAQEVRRLAERSQQATREIAGLVVKIEEAIKSSREAVDGGTKNNDQVYQAFQSIAAKIREMASEIREIARATQEQTASSQGIAESVQAIVQANEQSAAATGEVAASMENLNQMAYEVTKKWNGLKSARLNYLRPGEKRYTLDPQQALLPIGSA